MKKFKLPKNPNSNSPERKSIAVERILVGLGGVAICGATIVALPFLERFSGDRDFPKFPLLIGVPAILLTILAEMQERFQKDGSGEEDGGNGGWDWGGPDEPPLPNSPSGDEMGLVDEIEQYLSEHEPVSV